MTMTVENQVRAIAGSFILISVGLSQFHSENWLWFTAFVGANLLQFAFTKWCLLDTILRKIQGK